MAQATQLRWAPAGAARKDRAAEAVPPWRLAICVLLPFAAGFHLSYLLRTINALIAAPLGSELGIGAAQLGLLTAVYFLAFGAAQIPCGVLLDRHGPVLVQSGLLLVASIGALVFAVADNLAALMVGRALIGLGVAAGLMAGLKAIVLWVPAESRASVSGWMMMLGTLGAVTATAPADLLLDAIGWRGLFAVMAGMSALSALLILVLVPERAPPPKPASAVPAVTLQTILSDPRFWRIAPLSALGIGTSWALQGLWAAPWLRDVDGLEHGAVVNHLGVMALVLSGSGLILGVVADRLRSFGVSTATLLAGTFVLSLVGQLALVLDWPLPLIVPWSLIATAGVATVLGYTVLGEIFPAQASGRANGALNLLQVLAAFGVQSAFGAIVSLWEPEAGRYPPEAYRTALVFFITLQLIALGWFATAKGTSKQEPQAPTPARHGSFTSTHIRHRQAARAWAQYSRQVQSHVRNWRRTAGATLVLLAALGLAAVREVTPPFSFPTREAMAAVAPPAMEAAAFRRAIYLDSQNCLSGRMDDAEQR